MINVFDKLNLDDVMNCARISSQSEIAAEHYYNRHFKSLCLDQSSLLSLSNSTELCNLNFAEKMLRNIGCHVKSLYVDYTTFCINTIQPLCSLIQIHCRNLEEVNIICYSNVQITLPIYDSLKRLEATNCWFVSSKIVSKNLKSLLYSNQTSVCTQHLSTLLRQFPDLTELNVDANVISNENFKDIASLKLLENLSIEIVRPEKSFEKKILEKCCDVNEFARMLLTTENLKNFELVTPFYKKLSNATVDTHIRDLRKRANVSLVVTAFADLDPRYPNILLPLLRFAFMTVSDFRELRDDLDQLDALRATITFEGHEDMVCLERMVQLQVLRLSLLGNNSRSQRVDDVLWSLHGGAHRWTCRLRELGLNANYTSPVGLEILPTILAFVRIASKLTHLTITNCCNDLIAMKERVEKERPGLLVSFE